MKVNRESQEQEERETELQKNGRRKDRIGENERDIRYVWMYVCALYTWVRTVYTIRVFY